MEILARACWEVAWPLSEGWDFRQSWQRRDKIWCVLPQAEAKDGTEDGIPAAGHPEAIGQLDSQPPYIIVLLFAHLIKKTNSMPLSINGNNGLQVVPAKHTCFEEYLECHLLLVCLTNSSSNWQSFFKKKISHTLSIKNIRNLQHLNSSNGDIFWKSQILINNHHIPHDTLKLETFWFLIWLTLSFSYVV